MLSDEQLDALEEARDILASGMWTKQCFARLRNGSPCVWGHPKAACFCLTGVIFEVTKRGRFRIQIFDLLDCVADRLGLISLRSVWRPTPPPRVPADRYQFNDHPDTTLDDVLFLLDEAIEENQYCEMD